MKNIKDILQWGKAYLSKKGIDYPLIDIEVILTTILGKEKSYLYAHPEYVIPSQLKKQAVSLIRQRGKRLPLSYIFNEKEFFGNSFYVERGVFTPRPETEVLVEEVIKTLKKDFKDRDIDLYEIGLGTGVISITLALNIKNLRVIGCDISQKSLLVTKKNILRYNLQNKVRVIKTNDFLGIKIGKFDIIVSNPPYLSLNDYRTADREVRVEPKRALMTKERGLYLSKKIIREGRKFLKESKGYIFLEIGDGQGDYLVQYAKNFGYENHLISDYSGMERVLKLRT